MLSVVIPTYRKPGLLRQTLAALEADAAQLGDDCEVVVVDDGSADGTTPAVLAEFSTRLPLVDASAPQNEGRARARNRGWRAARGEWVLFLDDDIRLRPGSLVAHARAQQEFSAVHMGVVVTAPEIVDSPLFDYLDSRGIAKLPAGKKPPARYLLTQNVSVPRAALERIGGLDEDLGAYGFEDMELAFRLEEQAHVSFRVLPDSVGEHVHHHGLAEYLEKKRVCGRSTLPQLSRLHPDRMPEMRLDLLPGIDGRTALGDLLELSWKLRLHRLLEPGVARWPRGLLPGLHHRLMDYLVFGAYRDGLAEQRLP